MHDSIETPCVARYAWSSAENYAAVKGWGRGTAAARGPAGSRGVARGPSRVARATVGRWGAGRMPGTLRFAGASATPGHECDSCIRIATFGTPKYCFSGHVTLRSVEMESRTMRILRGGRRAVGGAYSAGVG